MPRPRPERPVRAGTRRSPGGRAVPPPSPARRRHGLRDPVRDSRHPENPGPAAMRLRYLHRPHRGREVRPRRHPVPDLIEVVLQVLLERPRWTARPPRCALVRLHLLPGLPDLLLRYLQTACRRLPARPRDSSRLIPVDQTNNSHGQPGPFAPPPLQGFHRYYEPVRRRAPRRYSAPCGSCRLGALPLAPAAAAAVSGRAFPRSAREPQTRLTPPLRRAPPGQ